MFWVTYLISAFYKLPWKLHNSWQPSLLRLKSKGPDILRTCFFEEHRYQIYPKTASKPAQNIIPIHCSGEFGKHFNISEEWYLQSVTMWRLQHSDPKFILLVFRKHQNSTARDRVTWDTGHKSHPQSSSTMWILTPALRWALKTGSMRQLHHSPHHQPLQSSSYALDTTWAEDKQRLFY